MKFIYFYISDPTTPGVHPENGFGAIGITGGDNLEQLVFFF